MTLNGETVVLNPNQCLFVPANAKHSATALTVDSVAYETFSPPRLDFRKK
jgi:mannose-6-phosphate isomerase-like protein (cupin superfamily)